MFGFGVGWAVVPGDEAVARSVVSFLEDRRVLFGERHIEDEWHCVQSALECRRFLTDQIPQTTSGEPLEATLKAMRAAFRQFVERAGPNASNFQHHHPYGVDAFSLALGELRSRVGVELARIAWRYKIDIDDELARIVPPEDNDESDPSWMVGFDEQ
jgi:hypothetical protein